jgi:thiamine biosynthesis protein ThiS
LNKLIAQNFTFICRKGIKTACSGTIQMINIILNGKDKQIDSNISIEQLLTSLNLENKRLAVEINQEIIPHSDFSSHILKELDKVEIVQAIGGGNS